MLNFRKIKQDFSQNMLKEGKRLWESSKVVNAKIVRLDPTTVRVQCQVQGGFGNSYECELEVSRADLELIDSNCDCTYTYDCQHLGALIYYLEEHLDAMLVAYSKEGKLADVCLEEKDRKELLETVRVAEGKEQKKKGAKAEKELLEEYALASKILKLSPFFLPHEELIEDLAELAVIITFPKNTPGPEIQLALRLNNRSKPLHIPDVKEFLDAIHYHEPIFISGRRYFFSLRSFSKESCDLLNLIIDHVQFRVENALENRKTASINAEPFGSILAKAFEHAVNHAPTATNYNQEGIIVARSLPCLYIGSMENRLRYSPAAVNIVFELEHFKVPAPKLMLKPRLVLDDTVAIGSHEALLYECTEPGMIYEDCYYRFGPQIKRLHLKNLTTIRDMTIPEPLFGTFVENALPRLLSLSEVRNCSVIDQFVTMPFAGPLEARCVIHYLNGELEAELFFLYEGIDVPASPNKITIAHINAFITEQGILARNLNEERIIVDTLFQDFVLDPKEGLYSVKSEKKIVQFMTEVVPQMQHKVQFECPENLMDQFIYDDTTFELYLKSSDRVDSYAIELKVDGELQGVALQQLWECLSAQKPYIELESGSKKKRGRGRRKATETSTQRILVLDLDKLRPIVELFDELGVKVLDDHTEDRPLWSLVALDPTSYEKLPLAFTIEPKLIELQQQMLGMKKVDVRPVPVEICAQLRQYQEEGTQWLERLRSMHLGGILADDMGLGKTLQAIVAITQEKIDTPALPSLIVCPTSLVYNWKEEFSKFNAQLKVRIIDGTPGQRVRLLDAHKENDVLVTSYGLLQKDIEEYKKLEFAYVVLDEAQHIKNPQTRNAKSVKLLKAAHKLILTGTPIENSLEELWSHFDFLMPGLLSSYERFVEKYLRKQTVSPEAVAVATARPSARPPVGLELLKRKVQPFILRRMKNDVLKDLPPVSDILYHCQLSPVQKELYRSYAQSAREELCKLVEKEGFSKVHIHVLATLTRLKQICCHPAIFAKEKAESGDSSKYDMLLELLPTLIEGGHKTVIFSQYTRMLQIMRDDLDRLGVRYSYLDGASKKRLDIVKEFNDDPKIPVFLVSLKAGGVGLNLVGADTVIHYDMWWNPAVENQATSRVHRSGQTRAVSSYKLVTAGTIEDKIIDLQNRKRELVTSIVSSDEEAISKLTWEEVLELLQA